LAHTSSSTGAQGALRAAQGFLNGINAIIQSIGYKTALATLAAANDTLALARTSAAASIRLAQTGLDGANATANLSISAAQFSLDAAKQSCTELHVWQAAQEVLGSYLKAEAGLLAAADAILKSLSTCAEKVTFDTATAGLNLATTATKELDAAKSILSDVESAADEFASFGQWMVNHSGNIFNVQSVHLSGSLNDAANAKKPFLASVKGVFADRPIDVSVDFVPGTAEEWVKGLVMGWVKEAKGDIGGWIKGL